MDNDLIVGVIVMALCGFGCGALFFGIGIWADKSEKPFGFWANRPIPEEKVTDVAAYNRANSVMWKAYSTVYWLSGIVSLFGVFGEEFILAGAIILTAAFIPGIFFLVSHYRKIEKRFTCG